MTDKLRVYEVAKMLGKSVRETLKLLDMWRDQRYARNDDDPIDRTRDPVDGNALSPVTEEALEVLKRRLERESKVGKAERRIHPSVIRRTDRQDLPPDPVELPVVIAITRDMAALLSLTPLHGDERAPAIRFRVEITPPLDGLVAIDAHFRRLQAEWDREAPAAELYDMLKAIAFGACHLITAPVDIERTKRPEPNPLGERPARMRDVIVVKIRNKISAAQRVAVSDVISGRRGYSNVLQESIAVRAHWARYHTGPRKAETKRLWRQAHRRGGEGTKERTYQLRS